MRKQLLIYSLAMGALAFSCKKDQVDPNSPIPQITAVSISPGTVKEFEDEITFVISYKDGDGDLGENNPNAKNLFVIDNRIGLAEEFRIPELAPEGANISIEGDLDVTLSGTGITDNSSSQTFTYTLYIVDRAGNESNRFETEAITVTQ